MGMRTMALGFVLLLTACGQPKQAAVSPAATTHAKVPQNLDEAVRAQGLTLLPIPAVKRTMTHAFGDEPIVEGRKIVIVETSGWSSSPTTFARRRDGTVYIVSPKPLTIVDRHVAAGCSRMTGGRGWFEEVEYQLPEGTTFGGTITAAYEDHVVVYDYADKQPDGSPCPPPMRD